MTRCSAVVALAALAFCPLVAVAQDAPKDTVGLRPGWAVEAQVNGAPNGALLRTMNSGLSLVAALSVSAQSQHTEDDLYGTTSSRYVTLSGRFGLRQHLGRGVVRPFVGLGASASYSRLNDGDGTTRGVGGYGEAGATYFVTRHLAVGAATELRFTRDTYKPRDGLKAVVTQWATSAPGGSLRLALYF